MSHKIVNRIIFSWKITRNSINGELSLNSTHLAFRDLSDNSEKLTIPFTNIVDAKVNYKNPKQKNLSQENGIQGNVKWVLCISLNSKDIDNKQEYYFTFCGSENEQRAKHAMESINLAISYLSLEQRDRLRIIFLQNNEEFFNIYQRLVIGNVLAEQEFWIIMDSLGLSIPYINDFIMERGLSNKLIKCEPKTTENPTIELTSEDLSVLYKLYPEFKAKATEVSRIPPKEGKKLEDKRIKFIEEQSKECTELVGGYQDILIEKMYTKHAPNVKLSKSLKNMFKNSYYTRFSCINGIGLYKSKCEAEINSVKVLANDINNSNANNQREDEDDKNDKGSGILKRLNRHSKRMICSIIKNNSLNKDHEGATLHINNGKLNDHAIFPKPDSEPSKTCAKKLFASIKSMKEHNTLDNYIMDSATAESTWKLITNQSAISSKTQPLERNPSGKLINAKNIFKETLLLLTIFYKQLPITRRKCKDVLDRLETLFARCERRIEESIARDFQTKYTYEQMLKPLLKVKELYKNIKRHQYAIN